MCYMLRVFQLRVRSPSRTCCQLAPELDLASLNEQAARSTLLIEKLVSVTRVFQLDRRTDVGAGKFS
jgi:hypothetical protein